MKLRRLKLVGRKQSGAEAPRSLPIREALHLWRFDIAHDDLNVCRMHWRANVTNLSAIS